MMQAMFGQIFHKAMFSDFRDFFLTVLLVGSRKQVRLV